jgi:hypothetical protein
MVVGSCNQENIYLNKSGLTLFNYIFGMFSCLYQKIFSMQYDENRRIMVEDEELCLYHVQGDIFSEFLMKQTEKIQCFQLLDNHYYE